MAKSEIEKRVEQLVRDYRKTANVLDVQIIDREMRYFRGSLYTVEIIDANKDPHENYVYVKGDRLQRFDNLKQLGVNIGTTSRLAEAIDDAVEFVGVAGVLAIMLTAAVCYLTLTRPDRENSVGLTAALSSILGFYFGKSARSLPK
jgi:hypothetical protein